MDYYFPYAMSVMFFLYLLYKGQKLTDWDFWYRIAAALGVMLVLRDIFALI